MKVNASGPRDARIMLVLEAPGQHEEEQGIPCVGATGDELDRLLCDSGLLPDPGPLPFLERAKALRASRDATIFLTNVARFRPPDNKLESFFLDSKFTKPNGIILEGVEELRREIEDCRPDLIVAFGNLAVWALHRDAGGSARGLITKWRGSMLEHNYWAGTEPRTALLIPTFHPANVFREWANRPLIVHDLKRAKAALDAKGWPKRQYNFIVRPTAEKALATLEWLYQAAEVSEKPFLLASDIETRSAHIACHGLAWSETEAICIPSMAVANPRGFYSLEEDLAIWSSTRALLEHPNVEVIGQNYLYDAQYFARRWGYIPRLRHDTLFAQSVAFPGLPKGLDFLSSMYCQYHQYWKEEGKTWDRNQPEDQLWTYNCKDAVATWEAHQTLQLVLKEFNLLEQYSFQMQLWHDILEMMLRGVAVDKKLRETYGTNLLLKIHDWQQDLNFILGQELNVKSPKQMQWLFYTALKMPVVLHKKTKRPTTDYDALMACAKREPLLRRLVDIINDLRSMGVFYSNFISAPLSDDGRLRSSYGIAETFRLTSSEDAFGTGTNLQNIPRGDEDDKDVPDSEKLLPNIRKMFIPTRSFPSRVWVDLDLAGADAQVVAWRAGDEKLKAAFRSGIKIHRFNAKDIFGQLAGPDGDWEPYYTRTKVGVHLTNYGGTARTCAGSLEISESEAKRFQDRWFNLHPEIRQWHEQTEFNLAQTRSVSNQFGYRRLYLDRVSEILPEALAWEPQSTVACVANRAWHAINSSRELRLLGVVALLQVHDSLDLDWPHTNTADILPILRETIKIVIPFEDPLIIPWGIKLSPKSWGDCAPTAWPT